MVFWDPFFQCHPKCRSFSWGGRHAGAWCDPAEWILHGGRWRIGFTGFLSRKKVLGGCVKMRGVLLFLNIRWYQMFRSLKFSITCSTWLRDTYTEYIWKHLKQWFPGTYAQNSWPLAIFWSLLSYDPGTPGLSWVASCVVPGHSMESHRKS